MSRQAVRVRFARRRAVLRRIAFAPPTNDRGAFVDHLFAELWKMNLSLSPCSSRVHALSLDFQEQSTRVFDDLFDGFEESDGFAAVNDPMVVGQCDVHHRTNDDLAIDRNRSFLDRVQP